MVADGKLLAWNEEEDDYTLAVGSINVVKPALYSDLGPIWALDAICGDLETLGAAVFEDGGDYYTDDFVDWFYESFGVGLCADPLFIQDVHIKPDFRGAGESLAAYAVADAAMAFGSVGAPLIGFGRSMVSPDRREYFNSRGLWDWVGPFNAQAWNGALVAARPQE